MIPRQQYTRHKDKRVGDASSIHHVMGKFMCKGFKTENEKIRYNASSILRIIEKAT